MKKIGSITPIWNQEIFLKPHFEMLSKLDRNVVLIQKGPLPNYDQHGIGSSADRSESILRSQFPNVEIYYSNIDVDKDFRCELYNEGLKMMQDCDLVFRLDPDMFFLEEDFDSLVELVREVDAPCFRMDFAKDSINYYGTWDFDHGLKDAKEMDPLVVDPKFMFTGILDYPAEPQFNINIDGWMCHHLRGWNKPKSTKSDWYLTEGAQNAFRASSNNGKWFSVPDEIRLKLENWKKELSLL